MLGNDGSNRYIARVFCTRRGAVCQLKLRWYHAKRRPQENKRRFVFLRMLFFVEAIFQESEKIGGNKN